MSNKQFELDDGIKNEDLQIKFKPVISIINQKIIGYESKNQGINQNDLTFSMRDIVKKVNDKDKIISVDRMYREQTVERYSNSILNNSEGLLFIDINLAVISNFIGSGIILNLVQKHKLKPQNIVLNITGEKFENVECLKDFITTYRSKGFLVCLSEIGSGFANLDKISFFEPDIIMISKNITESIEEDYYKQEVFKSLVNLSKNIGALVIADGIVSDEQALTTVDLGADMLTGEYFGYYDKLEKELIKTITSKLDKIISKYKMYMEEKIRFEKLNHKKYGKIIKDVIKNLSGLSKESFDSVLGEVSKEHGEFECIYILNSEGIQVTDTFTQYKSMLSQKALIFHPAVKKTNHSLKKYYYYLKNMALKKYITEPYISLATGNLCVTISEVFKSADGNKYIICIDFNPNDINIM